MESGHEAGLVEVRSGVVFGGVGWAHSGRDGLSCALQEADLLLEAHPRAGGPGPLGSLVPPTACGMCWP